MTIPAVKLPSHRYKTKTTKRGAGLGFGGGGFFGDQFEGLAVAAAGFLGGLRGGFGSFLQGSLRGLTDRYGIFRGRGRSGCRGGGLWRFLRCSGWRRGRGGLSDLG